MEHFVFITETFELKRERDVGITSYVTKTYPWQCLHYEEFAPKAAREDFWNSFILEICKPSEIPLVLLCELSSPAYYYGEALLFASHIPTLMEAEWGSPF